LSLGDQKQSQYSFNKANAASTKPMQLQQRILILGGKTGPHLPYFKGKLK
jgi:hypothetical protein